MSQAVPLAAAERVEHGVTITLVPAGTVVDLGGEWLATVTPEGLGCDCNKGVLCPLNPQHRKALTRTK